MGKKEVRFNQIIDILHLRTYISIKELSQLLGVSEMTIRRDLDDIESSGLAKNMNGMLVSNASDSAHLSKREYRLNDEIRVQNEAKLAIGQFAASLVEPDDIIILDTGSTTGQIFPFISPDMKLSVLCYNINILMQVRQSPHVNLAFAGGFYYPDTQMFSSAEGINFIRDIRANKLFISAAGIHEELGLTCINNYEVPTKRAVLQSAAQHILVADSSKFGALCASYFCDLSDIHTVITDSGLSDDWAERIQAKGIELHRVSV